MDMQTNANNHAPINNPQRYETSDFEEAQALLATGFTLEKVDATHRRALFIFKWDKYIGVATAAHYEGRLKLTSLKLAAARRALKSRLIRAQNEHGEEAGS